MSIKSIHIFLVVILFRCINGENLLLDVSQDDTVLFRDAGCTAGCMSSNFTLGISKCYERCKMSNQTLMLQKSFNNEILRLVCRSDDSLTVAISDQTNETYDVSAIKAKYNGSVILLTLNGNNLETQQRINYISDSPIIQIDNLQKNATYNLTATIFNGKSEYRRLLHASSFKTLEIEDYIPDIIPTDTIHLNYTLTEDNLTLLTTIEWQPATDMVCDYYFHLYDTTDDPYVDEPARVYRKIQFDELYHIQTEMLEFEKKYVLEIHGVNSKNKRIQGPKDSFEFISPKCWDIHGFNLTKCRPLPPSNISSTYQMINHISYRINVTWDLPKYLPKYYEVILNKFSTDDREISQKIDGSKNYAYFPKVNISSHIKYGVQVVAVSEGGYTESEIIDFNFKLNDHRVPVSFLHQFIIIGFSSMSILILALLIFVSTTKETFRKIIQWIYKDDMEIKPANVTLHKVLGEGAFGIVREGFLKPNNKLIAVKMLKENPDSKDVESFRSEIKLMKSVGIHENILKIIGYSTVSDRKLMLFMEFCSEGSLVDYLRKFQMDSVCEESKRPAINYGQQIVFSDSNNETVKYQSTNDCVCLDLFVANKCYISSERISVRDYEEPRNDFSNSETDQVHNFLTGQDLLSFAAQIANGMEFLAEEKKVHRDLAARNVLVCADKTVKIADFGLSRDINADEQYVKSGNGRLPMRWLALESMTEKIYTSQSDVWSYGILMYEIVTLGCTPYPEVKIEDLLGKLKTGYRMKQPQNCSEDFYNNVMRCCWNSNPNERPTFTKLRETISRYESQDVFPKDFFKAKERLTKPKDTQLKCTSS